MELFETTELIAHEVLAKGTRIIKASKGKGIFKVLWINPNNKTMMLSGRKKGNEFMANCEDYKIFIQVPNSAKTIY